MLIMPSNNTGFDCGLLFGRYPDRLAHLVAMAADSFFAAYTDQRERADLYITIG